VYELKFQGRVIARGPYENMVKDRAAAVDFTGRDFSDYKIELENDETHSAW